MTKSLGRIYGEHHKFHREPGFSILGKERGELLKNIIGEGKVVLDIGCRDGALTRYFVSGNKVLGIDVDDVALSEAAKLGIETKSFDLNGDWSELSNRKFDVIVAGEVLEHLYHPEKVLGKIGALLTPGDLLLGSVPNAFSLKNRLRYLLGRKVNTPLADPTHINHFHIAELRSMLKRYFSAVEIRGLGRYKRLAKVLPGPFAFDLFFICRK